MNSFIVVACLVSTAAAGFSGLDFPRRIGQSQLVPDGRISSGVDTDIRQVPYLVALETKGNKGYQFCAGALITPRHVLTAAQCLTISSEKMRIRVGSSRRNKGGTVYEIASQVKHPRFNSEIFDYDVGIIHLATNVTLGDSIRTIKVANKGAPTGTKLTIAGWGVTDNDSELSPVLQKAEVPIIEWDRCMDIMKMFLLSITERMMCTQDEKGTSACTGDGGGPTVHDGFVNGVISWGIACGKPLYPGVHINVTVPEIRSFISEQANV